MLVQTEDADLDITLCAKPELIVPNGDIAEPGNDGGFIVTENTGETKSVQANC